LIPHGCNFWRAGNDDHTVNDTDVISPDEQCDGERPAGEVRPSDDEVALRLAVRRHPAGKRRAQRDSRAA
jgi:hypothetical protein